MSNLLNPQNLNRYSYVLNNPVRYTDPTGLMVAVDDGGGCYICTMTDGGGTTGGGVGTHEGARSSTEEPVPNLADILEDQSESEVGVEVGVNGISVLVPNVLSESSDEPGENLACTRLKEQMEQLRDKLRSIDKQIDALNEKLKNTTDPNERIAILEELKTLYARANEVLTELNKVEAAYFLCLAGL